MKNIDYFKQDKEHYLPFFKRYPLCLTHGKGARVWDADGNSYIDALAGIAVNSIGHAHPKLVDAISRQAAKLIHISNFYISEPQLKLSKKLTEISGLDRVFLTNSGAESLEGAIKLARKYAHSKGKNGNIISFEGCFHGRTLATIATGKKKMQKGFAPMPGGFRQLAFNDIAAVREAADDNTIAFLLEPVQGEGGIKPAKKAFLKELRDFCDDNDILLIFDEVQCGAGRTGKWFAKDHYGVQPDILTMAKALGGGVPIGAVLASEKVAETIEPGDHGTTFGGNPLASAAAMATLKIIDEEKLMQKAEDDGRRIRQFFTKLQLPQIKEIRGLGMMIGIEFTFETAPLVESLMKNGLLANATAGNVLRLVPPLNMSREEIDEMLAIIEKTLKEFRTNE